MMMNRYRNSKRLPSFIRTNESGDRRSLPPQERKGKGFLLRKNVYILLFSSLGFFFYVLCTSIIIRNDLTVTLTSEIGNDVNSGVDEFTVNVKETDTVVSEYDSLNDGFQLPKLLEPVNINMNMNMNVNDHANNYNYNHNGAQTKAPANAVTSDHPKLTAYIEKVNLGDWEIKPLPVRTTKASDLTMKVYPNVNSCSKLPEQWPIDGNDTPTSFDPYLPWIHDVFPSADGQFIYFVAQNKRRCNTGNFMTHLKERFQPNVALFQAVPLKRVTEDHPQHNYIHDYSPNSSQRYRLSNHDEADIDALETRFICRFKPSMQETLSKFDFNYDHVTWRKAYSATFTKEGFDNHMIFSSQLTFKCPVPPNLQETIRLGTSVHHDYATLFVDIVPIRTPPFYGPPSTFLPPYLNPPSWNATEHWGSFHILPKLEDSGRIENIPICKPSLMTYPDQGTLSSSTNTNRDDEIKANDRAMAALQESGQYKHNLVACTWTSAGFHTRGGRTFVKSNDQRLLEWIEFHKMVGIDHIYVYDNSHGANPTNIGQDDDSSNITSTLKHITDRYPGYVTRINWPCKVCNNNPGNVDNKGERSSQYAAESSCRLRFGSHAKWISSFDTDEYLVPMGKYDNLKDLLDKFEKEDIRIVNFKSKRSKPQLKYFNTTDKSSPILSTDIPSNTTFLEVYNCNFEKPPRKNVMPAEKQIYRSDYVLQHFVHYSSVTKDIILTEEETMKTYGSYRRVYKEKHLRFVDEEKEATMLHTKHVTSIETRYWNQQLRSPNTPSILGIAVPRGESLDDNKLIPFQLNDLTLASNCYPVEKIEDYWAPKLTKVMREKSYID